LLTLSNDRHLRPRSWLITQSGRVTSYNTVVLEVTWRCCFGLTFCALSLILPLCCTSLAGTVMKSLLRKKNPTDIQKPSPPSPTKNTRHAAPIETPLYARFTSVKSGGQLQEKSRPTVSGPMPLGRPTRSNHEADDNRRNAPLPRHKPNSGRQGIAPGPQSLRDSLPAPRDAQPSLDPPYQNTRVNPTQVARQPIKAHTACKSYLSSPTVRRCSMRCQYAIRDGKRCVQDI
jgi:hypothetical protein